MKNWQFRRVVVYEQQVELATYMVTYMLIVFKRTSPSLEIALPEQFFVSKIL